MFGFFKELVLMGLVSNTVGQMVKTNCGTDYIKEMSVKQQNTMAEETIKIVERVQGNKIKEIDDSNFDDIVITGFLLLANEMGSSQAVKRQFVIMGLMQYLSNAIQQGAKISNQILSTAQTFIEKNSVS